MRRIGYVVSFIVGAGLLGAAIALAQPGPGRGAAGRGSAARIYDPATVETVRGVVERVEQVKGKGGGGGSGIHLLLKTDKEEIPVLLGPSWYVEKQSLALASQDQVEVRGSRISYEGKPAIVAAEVKKGEQVLELRDAAGIPLWRGQGRRGR
jgi:hypothetical protein